MYSKDTGDLLAELKNGRDIKNYLDRNKKDLAISLHEYLEKIRTEKNFEYADIIKKSGLNRDYVYKVFRGENKKPSRNKILAIGIAMNLNLDEIQYLLKHAQLNLLYPRNQWDSIVISAVEQKLNVIETNELLYQLGESEFLF